MAELTGQIEWSDTILHRVDDKIHLSVEVNTNVDRSRVEVGSRRVEVGSRRVEV